jgi:very-short-patch-repair endonuclease
MKVYLGGKMDGHGKGGNWRETIVTGIDHDGRYGDEYMGGCGAELHAADSEGVPPDSWPTLSKAIFGKHDYVGPYLVACDHGCYHTGNHATFIDRQHGYSQSTLRNANRRKVMSLCLKAMYGADILFFWIDDLTAYGTLAELVHITTIVGMADAIDAVENEPPSVRKQIYVATPDINEIDEMWFAIRLAQPNAELIVAPNPKDALLQVLAKVEEAETYSPIERMFIDKWHAIYVNSITPQYNVPGFRYRVDFAFPDDKIAVELDGYEYHSNKEQFTNDRKRQREMELAGWRFIRFSGSEVYKNTDACVRQAYEFWQSMSKKQVTEAQNNDTTND